jgi:UDP-glucose 4-epimerase
MEDRFLNFYRGRRVLIAGGLGFIGSNLAQRLVALGADVVLLDNLAPDYGGNLFNVEGFANQVRINLSDLRDIYSLRHLVRGQECVFNFVGQSGHLDSMRDPATDLQVNCSAQLALLETCRRECPDTRIVFASTRQVYGRPAYLPVDESHPVHPVDINGIHRVAAESYHMLYSDLYSLRATTLRLTNTIGPRMRIKDARQTFLGVWIRCLIEGRPFEVWGGEQLRDFTYVDDLINALLIAGVSEEGVGRIFNVGGCPPIDLLTLADLLCELNGSGSYHVREFPDERKAIDIGSYYADDRLMRAAFGWSPEVEFREGLERTLSYFRQHLPRYV